MALISTLPLDELCNMYRNALVVKAAMKRHPHLFCWKMEDLDHDMQMLYENMENKIPTTHQWQVEAIKQGLTAPAHSIKPGQRHHYYSLHSHRLEIQVVEEAEEGLWRCRMYLNAEYLNSVFIKTHTILTHYQLI